MRKISLMLFIALAVMFTACKKNETTVDVPFKYTHIDSLIMNANQGDADAQVELAMCFDTGKGVKQNKYDALGWYKEASEQGSKEAIEFLNGFYKNARIAADKGDKEAQRNMGSCYANGYGVEKDTIEAMNWFRKAAEQGHAEAQRVLGACYVTGYGVEKDTIEAMNWFRKAADQGDANAQNYIGACYAVGNVVKLDYAEAAKWYRKAADQGYADAQNRLGRCYENGNGVKLDYAEAAKWYRKAADQGYADAQNNLGWCYAKGNGVKQDYAEAAKWFRKAADQGNAYAQYNLGRCYGNGNGVKQDYAESAKWFRKAAEQGHADAQNNLGWCYGNGNGVKQDYAESAKWYRKAADQGIAYAQYNLGWCYAKGNGVKQDYAEAAKWYRKAAEQENGTAQVKLGLCYATGKGVEQNWSASAKFILTGHVDDFELLGRAIILVAILSILLIVVILGNYEEYKEEGLNKSQSILLLLINFLLQYLPLTFMAVLLAIFIIYGIPFLDYVDIIRCACIPVAIALIGSFITSFLTEMLKKSQKNNSISSESENETFKDRLLSGLACALGEVSFYALFSLAILVGFSYYWFITKALGNEPLSSATIYALLIFLVALLLGMFVCPMLSRLVWGWRNTSSRMDWKKIVLYTYCNKPLKKNQFIKGVTLPFFVVGLLPLLISPFVNSIGMCLFGILLSTLTAFNFITILELRKEPSDCMIQEIKGRNVYFVIDEDQPADNE